MAHLDPNFDPGMMIIDDPAAASPDEPKVSAPISDNSSGSLAVLLHPLVIINVSEHYTRTRAQNDGAGVNVFGAILGVQDGRRIELFNSFELVVNTVDGADMIDAEFLESKSMQFKEVFPNLDLLGWYTTGPAVTEAHMEVHKQMMSGNESPLFLLLDPAPKATARELPLSVFESVVEIKDDNQTTAFINTGYGLATEEAERIGIDHVAKVSGSTGPSVSSEVTLHLSTHRSAMEMMRERIVIIRNYLQAVEAGEIPRNHQILREIAGLCSRLPIGSDSTAGTKFLKNTNDALLISYMAMMTKGFNAMSEMLEKFPIVHDRGASRRGRTWF